MLILVLAELDTLSLALASCMAARRHAERRRVARGVATRRSASRAGV
jgi:hypothetical protein